MRRGVRAMAPERPEHRDDSIEFRQRVFAAHGKKCHFRRARKVARVPFGPKLFARAPHEKCMVDALDPMHIVPRRDIGPKHAYVEPEINGRPGCRPCHKLQEAGLLEFTDTEYNAAIDALNRYMHAPLRHRG